MRLKSFPHGNIQSSRIALFSGSSKLWRSECMACFILHFCPRHSCMFPPRDVRSCLMQSTIVRLLIRRITSPKPICLTPGHFSRATSRQPLCAIKSSGGNMDVASLLANLATSLHRFVEVCPKAESILRQSSASRPEGAALP